MRRSKTIMIQSAFIALATISMAPTVLAQGGMPDMGRQMAELGGSMHAAAKACGDADDQQLASLKQKQKSMLGQRGMDTKGFDDGYAAGQRKAAIKFASLSQAEKTQACQQIKQQMNAAAKQFGS